MGPEKQLLIHNLRNLMLRVGNYTGPQNCNFYGIHGAKGGNRRDDECSQEVSYEAFDVLNFPFPIYFSFGSLSISFLLLLNSI